jgi:general secretion pathway protein H
MLMSGQTPKPGIPCRADRQRGFTLVEMMIVLVIVALVMALIGTSLSRSISGAEIRMAARQMATSMRYTRTRAIIDKSEQVFLVDTKEGTYEAPEKEKVKLPEGMKIALVTARSELTSENVGGIRWFPDGGSTGGYVELEANGRIRRVNVAWLTGEPSLQKEDE